jgi:hypothetical protein
MPFVDEILKYKSLSIVGLEKNTGKTECLNYVLRRLEGSGRRLALTSIGVDGEKVDSVTGTSKPETELYESLLFITSEKHYRQRKLTAEILEISDRTTALGRLVTARALSKGKVMFSGPADTLWLRQIINRMEHYHVDTTIVDGAISRVSHGSPAVTESMILNTGAAVSANIPRLISHTKFVYELINLPLFEGVSGTGGTSETGGTGVIADYKEGSCLLSESHMSHQSHLSHQSINETLLSQESGIYALDENGTLHDLNIPSVFLLKDHEHELFRHGNTLYVSGAVSDRMLDFIRMQKSFRNTTLIIRDFTRLFVKPETYRAFINSGHGIRVLLKTRLLAVCVNPVSPAGYVLNSAELCAGLSEALKIPVYDIKKQ